MPLLSTKSVRPWLRGGGTGVASSSGNLLSRFQGNCKVSGGAVSAEGQADVDSNVSWLIAMVKLRRINVKRQAEISLATSRGGVVFLEPDIVQNAVMQVLVQSLESWCCCHRDLQGMAIRHLLVLFAAAAVIRPSFVGASASNSLPRMEDSKDATPITGNDEKGLAYDLSSPGVQRGDNP